MGIEIFRKGRGKLLVEGDEVTEVYCNTGKICFAVSTLLPGQKASIDKGHSKADEVCYVAQGQVIMRIPDCEESHMLSTGDAILIHPGIPHYTMNVGNEKSVTIWACAPEP